MNYDKTNQPLTGSGLRQGLPYRRRGGLEFSTVRPILTRVLLVLACSISVQELLSAEPTANQPRQSSRQGPLAALPSKPGAAVEKIKALGDNQWLNLEAPAQDPKWGPAPGRAYNNKMAFAPDLRGAFIFGEGVHGGQGIGPRADHYNDDVFFYDINAHAWVCVYPGSDVKALSLKLDANGFEATEDGQNPPVAIAVHGYECLSYDPDLGKFMVLEMGSPFSRALTERRKQWLGADGFSFKNVVSRAKNPIFFDVKTGRWERRKVNGRAVRADFVSSLWYSPKLKQTLFFRPYKKDLGIWFYDYAANAWTQKMPTGPAPEGAKGARFTEGITCYDTKRERLYIFNAGQVSVPWIYDVEANAYSNPEAKKQPFTAGDPEAGLRMFSSASKSWAHYDSANDVVVVMLYLMKGKAGQELMNMKRKFGGMAVYDPGKNEWQMLPQSADRPPDDGSCRNAFYDPELGVHFIYRSHDSSAKGEMWVYRYKRAPEKK